MSVQYVQSVYEHSTKCTKEDPVIIHPKVLEVFQQNTEESTGEGSIIDHVYFNIFVYTFNMEYDLSITKDV